MGISPSQPLRIFLSSTYSDLEPYRRKIIDAIGRLRHVAINMEQFGARATPPIDASAKEVALANLFIGIISNRYGEIHPVLDKSASEIEFEEAKAKHIPILMYIPQGDFVPGLPRASNANEEAHRQRFLACVKQGGSFIYEEYNDANDLPYIIATDIIKYIIATDIIKPMVTVEQNQGIEGIEALQNQDYVTAIAQLENAHVRQPSDGTIAFLYALALLRGRSPGRLKESGEVVQIEELLKIAMKLKTREVAAFWGVIKQDFWVQRYGYDDDRQEARQLLQRAQRYASSRALYALLLIAQPDVMFRFAEYFG